ncbi:polysaccharide biosynthesis protein [Thalassotalea euphylliae]|uniref:Polysaccharide biosynthesis protein n=1 Tax=Thalassotalea euphylliae TaxID=1655234 RepID=A0A3E0UMQ8_9GAMM|nr:nucleoside-diphosphate sugar epimerase/dehydratase [Thalassotalea euphylliae]REL36982.1 polysaccharide biosynthesis protein [Thalassotalea euphylliae]
MSRRIDLIPSQIKLVIALSYDLGALSIAFFLSYFLRLGGDMHVFTLAELSVFVLTAGFTLSCFYLLDVYSSIVRYFNAKASLKITGILIGAACVCYLSSQVIDAFVPRSIPFSFLVLSTLLIAGARALVGITVGERLFEERDQVVIYGAGSTGRQLSTALNQSNKYHVLAIVDEKTRYKGRNLHGTKIYGLDQLELLIKKYGQFKVLIAVSQVNPERMKEIVNFFEPYALELLTVPSMHDMVSGKHKIDELREVSVDELLGREPVEPIPALLSDNIKEKVVLVSGAGGSIGKELCRQIISQTPRKLILLDVSEAFLYEINQELNEFQQSHNTSIELVPTIGNVQNGMLMTRIIRTHQVQTIYHAAAYKHVPMVENNVIAGITNNVLGTYEIAQAAVFCEVETFVLISTDKAVRPTNVMGATKRMAELVLQGLAKRDHQTRFVMVRFGNVLGSSGSVVPLFKKQIRSGGPITVTHPDIIRYFMTIPEAAQLVIQAGAMGKGGDVFVLDMGKPVKIVDLAVKMTHMMGFTVKDQNNPAGDIEIQYSGLRPGEKLYEELLIDDHAQATDHQRILTANERSISWAEVMVLLNKITEAMKDDNIDEIRQLLIEAPLGFVPAEHSAHSLEPAAKVTDKAADKIESVDHVQTASTSTENTIQPVSSAPLLV